MIKCIEFLDEQNRRVHIGERGVRTPGALFLLPRRNLGIVLGGFIGMLAEGGTSS